MIEETTKRFGADVIFKGGRWLWRAASDLLVQFKMLGEAGLPRNYPTRRALEFNAQLDLFDIPAGMRVTLGYMLDEETSEVVAVRVVGQDGSRILFSRELIAAQRVLPIFAPTAAPTTPPPRRLRAKRDANTSTPKKQTGGGESGEP